MFCGVSDAIRLYGASMTLIDRVQVAEMQMVLLRADLQPIWYRIGRRIRR